MAVSCNYLGIARNGNAFLLFRVVNMIEGYVTIKEKAKQWNVTCRTLQCMCSEGRIPGATKFGDVWAIPEDAVRPADGRVKSGEYKNWRTKTK